MEVHFNWVEKKMLNIQLAFFLYLSFNACLTSHKILS